MNGCTLPVMGSVGVVRAVQGVVVQQSVQPVVHELGGAGVQKKQLHQPRAVVLGEPRVPEARGFVHKGHDDRLQNNKVVPVVLAVDLFEVDAFGLDFRVLRDKMHARERNPKLRMRVPKGGDREHVERPVIPVVLPKRHGGDERDEQQVLQRANVLPRELVPEPGLQRHDRRVRVCVEVSARRGCVDVVLSTNRRRHRLERGGRERTPVTRVRCNRGPTTRRRSRCWSERDWIGITKPFLRFHPTRSRHKRPIAPPHADHLARAVDIRNPTRNGPDTHALPHARLVKRRETADHASPT